MIEDSLASQAKIPHAVRRLLSDALALRAARDYEVIDAEEFGLLRQAAGRQAEA